MSKKRIRCSSAAVAAAGLVLALVTSSIALLGRSLDRYSIASHDWWTATLRTNDTNVSSSATLQLIHDHQQDLNGTTALQSTSNDTCVSLSSKEWLMEERLGNAPLESNQDAMDMILSTNISFLLRQQSLCHVGSRFLDWNNHNKGDPDIMEDADAILKDSNALRLIYLAFHIHQHEPAWREANHRLKYCRSNDENLLLSTYKVGNFDYECPNAKFLVVGLGGGAGLGAVMRLVVVNALLAGIASNRVVLFVNSAPDVGPKFVRNPWRLASCPRQDLQCIFMPSSPCVLTKRDLDQAHVLQRGQYRQIIRNGELDEDVRHHKVVVTEISPQPHKTPPNLRQRLVQIVQQHIVLAHGGGGSAAFAKHPQYEHDGDDDNTNTSTKSNRTVSLTLLERAVERIYEIEEHSPEGMYYYFAHRSKVHHGAIMYVMRPRPEHGKFVDTLVANALPDQFDPQGALGLPIRASDKCRKESECLSFEQYMRAMAYVWKTYYEYIGTSKDEEDLVQQQLVDIVVTTEDEQVLKGMQDFHNSSSSATSTMPFPFRFVTNKQDVLQGTGSARGFGHKNTTSDQVMLSSLAALKLQLSAKYVVGNCCSNFHLLLFDLLREGCGAASGAVATCLQELNHSEFRVCCHWTKSDECKQRRAAAQNSSATAKP